MSQGCCLWKLFWKLAGPWSSNCQGKGFILFIPTICWQLSIAIDIFSSDPRTMKTRTVLDLTGLHLNHKLSQFIIDPTLLPCVPCVVIVTEAGGISTWKGTMVCSMSTIPYIHTLATSMSFRKLAVDDILWHTIVQNRAPRQAYKGRHANHDE